MSGDFTVKLNRREGTVEITGSDGQWVADQLAQILPILDHAPSSAEPAAPKAPKRRQAAPKTASSEGNGTKPRASRGGGSRLATNTELAGLLTRDVTDSLEKYVDERRSNFDKSTDQAAIIAGFLLDALEWDGVSPDDLYTVYSVMGWRAPNTRSALINGRARDGYFGPARGGKSPLTRKGENFARHDSTESS